MNSFSGLEIFDLFEEVPVLLTGQWRDSILSIAFAMLAVAILALLAIERFGGFGWFFRKRISIVVWFERFDVSAYEGD